MTLREFQQRLVASDLMTAAEAEQAKDHLLESLGPAAADAGPQEFGKFLVTTKRATLFQVAAAVSGRPPKLVMGDYILVDKVASGGMGDVYKGVHKQNGQTAVVKVLPAASASDPELVKRFHREIQLLSAIRHPNIVGAFDAGAAGGCQYLAMEYVDGSDLGRIVRQKGTMPPEDAVEVDRQAAEALGFAHEKGVIHRDVKPSNLMIDHLGMVKILDLGLARILHNDDGLTSTGSVLGSVDYMAPEQGNDSKVADHRADVYALGCTLYYLMTGRIVFEARNISQKLLAHQDSPPPSLLAANPATPKKLEQLYLKMLSKKPTERPTRMADLIAVLKKIQKDLPLADLTKYVRGSSVNFKDASSAAFAATAPGLAAKARPSDAGQSFEPLSPMHQSSLKTMVPARKVPLWRDLAGSVAAVGLVAALLATLFLSAV
jgi:serine/threonine protein kinase